MYFTPPPPVIAIVGPTGSGKTGLALEVAEALDAEIISADSMQFYAGMEIGTAAPTAAERGRVPHHFVGFLNPDQQVDAAMYEQLARAEVRRLHALGKPAVVVGGSGLYVSALLDGIVTGPGRDEAVRRRLKEEAATHGNAWMMERLRAVDPAYAALLSSENDLVRIVRALEVYELTGRPFSALHAEHRAQAEPLAAAQFAIDWPREVLYQRLNQRVAQMAALGWVEEVERLLAAGHGPHLQRLKALGYREIAAYLRGEQALDAALEAVKQHHRRYAKRQIGWFRADPRVQWLAPGGETLARVLEAAGRRLPEAHRPGK